MTEQQVLEKYRGAEQQVDPTNTLEFHNTIVSFKPQWETYEATRSNEPLLSMLEIDAPAAKAKAIINSNIKIVKACLDVLEVQDEKPVQWVLMFLYDMLREDASCFSLFEDALHSGIAIYDPVFKLLEARPSDVFIADKAAWFLSSIIAHMPGFFTTEQVQKLVTLLMSAPGGSAPSEFGVLESLANLLKADVFRKLVWSQSGVADRIFRIRPATAPANVAYKFVFALWMVSFDADISAELKTFCIIKKVKDILTYSRVEKVIRLCLLLLRNLMSNRDMCEDIVEENLLDAVQVLEFEKWRDSELYDEIHSMSNLIQTEVQTMSNFDRYERELQSGTLTKGFIHSSKFWAENVMKFEQNDFRSIKMLAALLQSHSTDATTLALACHDIGEFVTLHPLGKRKVAELHVKERVMELMGSNDAEQREVRREALLCCQKLMLNKWQDLDKAK